MAFNLNGDIEMAILTTDNKAARLAGEKAKATKSNKPTWEILHQLKFGTDEGAPSISIELAPETPKTDRNNVATGGSWPAAVQLVCTGAGWKGKRTSFRVCVLDIEALQTFVNDAGLQDAIDAAANLERNSEATRPVVASGPVTVDTGSFSPPWLSSVDPMPALNRRSKDSMFKWLERALPEAQHTMLCDVANDAALLKSWVDAVIGRTGLYAKNGALLEVASAPVPCW